MSRQTIHTDLDSGTLAQLQTLCRNVFADVEQKKFPWVFPELAWFSKTFPVFPRVSLSFLKNNHFSRFFQVRTDPAVLKIKINNFSFYKSSSSKWMKWKNKLTYNALAVKYTHARAHMRAHTCERAQARTRIHSYKHTHTDKNKRFILIDAKNENIILCL